VPERPFYLMPLGSIALSTRLRAGLQMKTRFRPVASIEVSFLARCSVDILLDFHPIVHYLFSSVKADEAIPIGRVAMFIYFTALPFVRLENGSLAPGDAIECPHVSAVMRRADSLVRNEASAGAVALAHIDSPDFGDFEGAMILKTFGDVPAEFGSSRQW
jgi:hypothetical protein